MTEYIDKSDIVTRLERVIKYGKQAADGAHTISAEVVLEVVNSLPATDVVVRKTGRWKQVGSITPMYECDQCHAFTLGGNFCPNCGAKMDGGSEDG